jgi:hypothetical protein
MLREEHRLRRLRIVCLRENFCLRGIKIPEVGENCIMRRFIIYAPHKILGLSNEGA